MADGWSHDSEIALGPMICIPLTFDRLADMDVVLGERGVARRCYCTYWRRPDGGFGDERSNRARFSDAASGDRAPGLLGYVKDDPVGWVQVGPRADFPTLDRSRLLEPVDDTEVWSVNCFVVRVGYRRKGVASALLRAALAFARSHGAETVEAYPVDGVRSSTTDLYTGTMGMFTALGFAEVLRRNATRPIVRLDLASR